MTPRTCRPLSCLLSLVLISLCALPATAENWPRFRGAEGDGHTADKSIPVKWSAEDVVWKTGLPGVGQSSPIVWGDRIFLTAAEKQNGQVARIVFCLDRSSGKLLWKKVAHVGAGEELHQMNTYATPSCATDGQYVIAFFGRGGLHCYDVDGKHRWSREVGEFPNLWGTAASPIILGDQVIQNCDAIGESSLMSINKKTGETIWETKRKDTPRGGWSTPILIDTGKRKELVLNGEFGAQAYDPETGADYWYCKSFNGRGTPVPAYTKGLVVVVNGKPGDIYAVKPGGNGDVTDTHMAWHSKRNGGRDLPSPIAVGDYVMVVSMSGVATCYRAADGKTVWVERLDGNYSGSPFVAGGLVYFQNEAGGVTVVKPGEKLNTLAHNSIGADPGEIFRSSPTPNNGQVLLRSDTVLYCVGK